MRHDEAAGGDSLALRMGMQGVVFLNNFEVNSNLFSPSRDQVPIDISILYPKLNPSPSAR